MVPHLHVYLCLTLSHKFGVIRSCKKLSILTLQNRNERESWKPELLRSLQTLDPGASAEYQLHYS